MAQKTWSVHSDMENAEKPVQNQKKKRTQSDKIGRLKYNQQLLKQTLAEVEEVKLMLRTIFAGLKASFIFACAVGLFLQAFDVVHIRSGAAHV